MISVFKHSESLLLETGGRELVFRQFQAGFSQMESHLGFRVWEGCRDRLIRRGVELRVNRGSDVQIWLKSRK